jgi:hypothetical protein
MANRSDRGWDNPPMSGRHSDKAEWDLVRGYHQGQRSCATTSCEADFEGCTRQNAKTSVALSLRDHPLRTFIGGVDTTEIAMMSRPSAAAEVVGAPGGRIAANPLRSSTTAAATNGDVAMLRWSWLN